MLLYAMSSCQSYYLLPSSRQIPGVDRNSGAGQVTRLVGGQPQYDLADRLWRQQVAVGEQVDLVGQFQHVFVACQWAGATGEGVVDSLVLAHVGIHAGRANGIDVDVIR